MRVVLSEANWVFEIDKMIKLYTGLLFEQLFAMLVKRHVRKDCPVHTGSRHRLPSVSRSDFPETVDFKLDALYQTIVEGMLRCSNRTAHAILPSKATSS
jgi:hypothetical protein